MCDYESSISPLFRVFRVSCLGFLFLGVKRVKIVSVISSAEKKGAGKLERFKERRVAVKYVLVGIRNSLSFAFSSCYDLLEEL